MAVTISGMFGDGHTYFADSPVVIKVDGLYWGETVTSPFTIVEVDVIYKNKSVGIFRADTGGQTSISFDISSALRAIWSNYEYTAEVDKATQAAVSTATSGFTPDEDADHDSNGVRTFRSYSLIVYTEYLDSGDGGFTRTRPHDPFTGGQCAIGHMTEWERSIISSASQADMSYLQNKNQHNGDASTKPKDSPEHVGSDSITSWVDVSQDGTKSVFYPKRATPSSDSPNAHAPLVLRDSQPYVDFLFINRRGAIETCSGMTKEAMGISTDTKQYGRTEGPSFKPTRSLMAIGSDGRRSWQMSSGYVPREWAEWWTMEFLSGKRKQWWMLWQGPGLDAPRYVPVIVKPAKSDTSIYDKSKQQMPHVDFTVTLALEG